MDLEPYICKFVAQAKGQKVPCVEHPATVKWQTVITAQQVMQYTIERLTCWFHQWLKTPFSNFEAIKASLDCYMATTSNE